MDYEYVHVDLEDRQQVLETIAMFQQDAAQAATAAENYQRMAIMLLGRLGGEATFTREQLYVSQQDDQHIDTVVSEDGDSVTVRLH